jgi:hypothetical protein
LVIYLLELPRDFLLLSTYHLSKNLITGLGVVAVVGIAYYFWRRNQLVLAKQKSDSNKSVDTTNVIATTTTTTTKSEFYGQESEEEPIISNINTYPYGRYNSVNVMVDEANY